MDFQLITTKLNLHNHPEPGVCPKNTKLKKFWKEPFNWVSFISPSSHLSKSHLHTCKNARNVGYESSSLTQTAWFRWINADKMGSRKSPGFLPIISLSSDKTCIRERPSSFQSKSSYSRRTFIQQKPNCKDDNYVKSNIMSSGVQLYVFLDSLQEECTQLSCFQLWDKMLLDYQCLTGYSAPGKSGGGSWAGEGKNPFLLIRLRTVNRQT